MSSTSPTYGMAQENRLNIVGTGPIIQPQVIQSSSRSNSMPSWRGHLPMKFEPMTIDQYQVTSHFSQKVFLGGIPAELTEG